jgi:hypothetical protein
LVAVACIHAAEPVIALPARLLALLTAAALYCQFEATSAGGATANPAANA